MVSNSETAVSNGATDAVTTSDRQKTSLLKKKFCLLTLENLNFNDSACMTARASVAL